MLRERVIVPKDEASEVSAANDNPGSPPKTQQGEGSEHVQDAENGLNGPNCSARSLLKSSSISASQCVVVNERNDTGVSMRQKYHSSFLVTSIYKLFVCICHLILRPTYKC